MITSASVFGRKFSPSKQPSLNYREIIQEGMVCNIETKEGRYVSCEYKGYGY